MPAMARPAAPRRTAPVAGRTPPVSGAVAPAGDNTPKPCVSDEPCSACGRVGALYSKRQMKIDVTARKCLECMPSHNPELTAQVALQVSLGAAPAPAAGGQPTNLPNPSVAAEPCSGCGRMGVLFSKRQMQVDASRRRCLECLPPRVGGAQQEQTPGRARTVTPPLGKRLQAAAPLSALMAPVAAVASSATPTAPNLPNPQTAAEPCSGCGRVGVLFSKRQIAVDASRRRCLECLPPRVKTGEEGAALATGAAPAGPNLPNPQMSPEPCSACGQMGVLFSKRQMAIDASKRKCLACMPARGTKAAVGVPNMEGPRKRKFGEITQKMVAAGIVPGKVKGPEAPPPKENLSMDPCTGCGRTGMTYSNRQIKVDAAQRLCLECMEVRKAEKRARQEAAGPPALA